jgi:hypothetical protein
MKQSMSDEIVMCRDASFWRKPDTTTPKKYHRANSVIGVLGHPVAACDIRINLSKDSAIDASKVKVILCLRCYPAQ